MPDMFKGNMHKRKKVQVDSFSQLKLIPVGHDVDIYTQHKWGKTTEKIRKTSIWFLETHNKIRNIQMIARTFPLKKNPSFLLQMYKFWQYIKLTRITVSVQLVNGSPRTLTHQAEYRHYTSRLDHSLLTSGRFTGNSCCQIQQWIICHVTLTLYKCVVLWKYLK